LYYLKINLAEKWGQGVIPHSVKKIVVKKKCFTIKDDDRKQLFKLFWDNMTWCERKTYVAALCQIHPTEVNKTGTNISR